MGQVAQFTASKVENSRAVENAIDLLMLRDVARFRFTPKTNLSNFLQSLVSQAWRFSMWTRQSMIERDTACITFQNWTWTWTRLKSHGSYRRFRRRLKCRWFDLRPVIGQKVADISIQMYFRCRAVNSTAHNRSSFAYHADHRHTHDDSHQTRHP